MKLTLKIFFLLILNALYLILNTQVVEASTMSNDNWIIEMGSLNSGAGVASDSKNSLTSTIGQTAPGLYAGKNYNVKAGFSYIYPLNSSFSFSLEQTAIDFGLLSATNPVSRTSTITISNPSSPGYQVVAYEDHSLINGTNTSIPNTTCDNGSCTATTAAPWTSTLTYGFGYRCDSISDITCSSTFSQADYYRQFADISQNESPQTIVIGKGAKPKRKAKITYKVNISGTQLPGVYSNAITYIAAPSY
jgi:hypothetical protein